MSLDDAGVAYLTDAGVASLADLAGSVAGGMMNLAVPVRDSEEMALLPECAVRDRWVFEGLVYRDCEMDCSDCTSPNAWRQEIRDDLGYQYVNGLF